MENNRSLSYKPPLVDGTAEIILYTGIRLILPFWLIFGIGYSNGKIAGIKQERQNQLEKTTMDARDIHQWAIMCPEIPSLRERDLHYQERLSKF